MFSTHTTLCLQLALAPVEAPPTEPSEEAPDDSGAEASVAPDELAVDPPYLQRWREGEEAYENDECEVAIDRFRHARKLLMEQEEPLVRDQRDILHWLALAYLKADGLAPNPSYLRLAREHWTQLLEKSELYEVTAEWRGVYQEYLAETVKRIEEVEQREREREQAETDRRLQIELEQPKVDEAEMTRGRTLTLSGIAVGSVGVAMAGVMTVGLVLGRRSEARLPGYPTEEENARIEELERGRQMNRLAVGSGIAAGVLVVAGATVIVVGQLKRRRARNEVARTPHLRWANGGVALAF